MTDGFLSCPKTWVHAQERRWRCEDALSPRGGERRDIRTCVCALAAAPAVVVLIARWVVCAAARYSERDVMVKDTNSLDMMVAWLYTGLFQHTIYCMA